MEDDKAELDLNGLGGTNSGWSSERSMKQEDGQSEEHNVEQHVKQGQKVGTEEGCSGRLHQGLGQEEWLRRPCSHSGQRQTAKSCQLWLQASKVLDIFSHQVGADVWGQVVEKEALEHKNLRLVNSVIQRK